MRRYWVPTEAIEGNEVSITGETLHHIRDVCRMEMGSKFEVILESGQAHLVEITSESKRESRARIIETRIIEPLPTPHIHLALSIPRFPVFDSILERAVELGVKSIHPFFSEFSFIHKAGDVWDKKEARFEKIIRSATQQSGRGELMRVEMPVNLEELLKNFNNPTFNRESGIAGLFAYEGEARLSFKAALGALRSQGPFLKEVWVFVGSEGGFSDREVQLFQSLGLDALTLGSQVLRVETACLALISIIKYDLDLMR